MIVAETASKTVGHDVSGILVYPSPSAIRFQEAVWGTVYHGYDTQAAGTVECAVIAATIALGAFIVSIGAKIILLGGHSTASEKSRNHQPDS